MTRGRYYPSMPLEAQYGGTTYDFAVSSNEATWWRILASLGLPQTGVPFDEGVLARARYELRVRVARYEDAICHHAYGCDFGCEEREVGPVWDYRVVGAHGPILCSGCITYAAGACCPDCPPARHEQTCPRCGSHRFSPRKPRTCGYCRRDKCERAMQPFAIDGEELATRQRALLVALEEASLEPVAARVKLARGHGRSRTGLQKLGVLVREALRERDLADRIRTEGTAGLRKNVAALVPYLADAARRSLRDLVPTAYELRNSGSSCTSCARRRTLYSAEEAITRLLTTCEAFVDELAMRP